MSGYDNCEYDNSNPVTILLVLRTQPSVGSTKTI